VATRKDQLDAFVFARRRMVSNLVAPTPTGSDEAAPRPVKTFFTSAILSAIAVAGVAVLGVFKPSAPSGWQSGLAVDSTSGASYIRSPQDNELHPVVNITSAKLILGSKFKKFDVPDSIIHGSSVTIGAPFGILAAPPDVPTASNVDLTQWSLCVQAKNPNDSTVGGGRTVLEIGYGAGGDSVASGGSGFVVHDSQNRNYLVFGDHEYPIDPRNGPLNALTGTSVNSGVAEGPWVSSTWLGAFQQGTAITFPTLTGLGEPLPAGLQNQPGTHVGDYGQVTNADGTQSNYIETENGLVSVSQFVFRLYESEPELSENGVKLKSITITPSQATAAQAKNEVANPVDLRGAGADWPQATVLAVDLDGKQPNTSVFCAGFTGGKFDAAGAPALSLYYGADLPHPLSANAGLVQAGGAPSGGSLADVVYVKPGHAVLARAVAGGQSATTGSVYLIPDTGTSYPMAGEVPTTDSTGKPEKVSALSQLQYTSVAVQAVPQSWVQLLQAGPTLDPIAAGKTPSVLGQCATRGRGRGRGGAGKLEGWNGIGNGRRRDDGPTGARAGVGTSAGSGADRRDCCVRSGHTRDATFPRHVRRGCECW
jgi:type VII secretion protein EccB